MLEKRQNILDQIEMLQVLLAVEAGELSEGQASKFLAIDRVSLRKKRIDFIHKIRRFSLLCRAIEIRLLFSIDEEEMVEELCVNVE